MSGSRLRIGVSGCGGIASCIFKECQGLECIEVVAGYDPNPSKMAAFQEVAPCEIAATYEDLLSRKDIDAIVLAAPPRERVSQALQAAAAGKAVFIEKPLALSVHDANGIVTACRKAGVPLMVGQVLRYFGGFRGMAEKVRAGEYGEIRALQVNRISGPFPDFYRDAWRLKKETSGGLLFEVHVHELDLSRYLCGNPKRVLAASKRIGQDPETDYKDLYMGTIEFENGALGQYHFSHISAQGETSIRVFLDKGVARAGFGGAWFQPWEGDEVEIPASGDEEAAYRHEIRLFAEAVLRNEPVAIPGEEGLWSVAMAEAMEKSAEKAVPVEIVNPIQSA